VGLSRKFNLTLEVVSEQINQSENELIKDHISVLPGRFCQYAPVGKQVWLIILIKLFIMFVVLKLFFFPNFLKSNFKNDADRSDHVLENLTNINN
jgi:hypothetical protein